MNIPNPFRPLIMLSLLLSLIFSVQSASAGKNTSPIFRSARGTTSLLLSEDFEDGVLDGRITVETTGTFDSAPGIKDITEFGSSKAFGFGKSTCSATCFHPYTTKLIITFTSPTYISTLSFKEMELVENWGSAGEVLVDGIDMSGGDSTHEFGREPFNDHQADSTYRTRLFQIDEEVTVLELRVWDITNLSEIFIDDLQVTGESYTCTPQPSGIVSWWPGDGHPFDLVGENDGTLVNGASYAPGMVGKSFLFDGVDDTVNVSYNDSLQALGDHFSLEAWVKADSLSATSDPYFDTGILDRDGFARGYALGTKGAAFIMWIGKGEQPGVYAISDPITTGRWYHVVGTYDGTYARIYVNGELQGTQAAELIHFSELMGNFTIGSTHASERFFDGQIDEATLYNRTLTDEEISTLYGGCATQPTGLVSWWRFDEGSGTNTEDVIGSNDGILSGATWTQGKVGGALRFDGADDYVALPDSASSLLNNSSGTITVWVNPSLIGGNDVIAAFGTVSPGQGIGLGIWNNIRPWHAFAPYDWDSTTPVTANKWTFIAYAWDDTTEYIYKNGTFTESRTRNFNYAPGQARIGHGFWGDPANAFPGLIDELKVYNRKLTDEEISATYTGCPGKCKPCFSLPANLVSWWPFNEGSGTTARDVMGNNNGTLHEASWTTGKVHQALYIDGVNDYVAMPDSSLWDLGSDDFTIDAWIKTTTPGNTMRLLSAGSQADGENQLWTFGYGSHPAWGIGNRLNFAYWNASSYVDLSSNQVDLVSGSWNHIALVRSGTNLQYYFNGDQVGKQSIGSISLGGGSTGAIIGARYYTSGSDTTEFASGNIDEVELFERALTAEEIAAIYSAGCSGKCGKTYTTYLPLVVR